MLIDSRGLKCYGLSTHQIHECDFCSWWET